MPNGEPTLQDILQNIQGQAQQLQSIENTVGTIRDDVAGFRTEITARVAAIETQDAQRFEFQKVLYQQASAWVGMANTITWSLGSIFLVAGIIALNGAINTNDVHWRHVAGFGVIALALIWLLIDVLYGISAVSARNQLEEIEEQWVRHGRGFFARQNKYRALRWIVWGGLVFSMLGMAYGGLIVARPQLNLPFNNLIVDVPIR
jgi:Na+-transporting NADH:ubiquinone oxidoreductase subunit NqrB